MIAEIVIPQVDPPAVAALSPEDRQKYDEVLAALLPPSGNLSIDILSLDDFRVVVVDESGIRTSVCHFPGCPERMRYLIPIRPVPRGWKIKIESNAQPFRLFSFEEVIPVSISPDPIP